MDDLSRYHALLRDETRRKIIVMLGEQGKSGFKDLRDSLKVGTGTIYYHLDLLEEYITQDENRKYQLNGAGRLLYESLRNGRTPTILVSRSFFSNRFLSWYLLSPVMSRICTSYRFLPIPVVAYVLGSLGSALARLEPALLFYFPSSRSWEVNSILFVFYWLGAFLFSEVTIFLLFKRSGDHIHFLICMGLSMLPLSFYPFIHILLLYCWPPTSLVILLRIVLLILQSWTLSLMASAFSFGKGLRLDRAALLSLSILYANLAMLLLVY